MGRGYRSVGLVGLASWMVFATAALCAPAKQNNENSLSRSAESSLAELPDGAYQFCTEPAPSDWKDGAGVCLNFFKQGATVEGYYGYPHTERFVCLRGEVAGNWLRGNGLAVSWSGHPWTSIPQTAFSWDSEGRLTLSAGAIARTEEEVSWIVFEQADLNMQDFNQYPSPRMNSPEQLCDWSVIKPDN